ncbi:hypothetical protein CVD23_08925 [Bacillus sp. V33-4]|nr:hypothetical protein CVD23_08925 [Bacillus sp. V33-4]
MKFCKMCGANITANHQRHFISRAGNTEKQRKIGLVKRLPSVYNKLHFKKVDFPFTGSTFLYSFIFIVIE